MLTEATILKFFEERGLPGYGVFLSFLPSDRLMEDLTRRFNVEFAVMYKINHQGYSLMVGTHNSVRVSVGADEILIKHTHPRGTPIPSCADVGWLITCQNMGSPQKKSIILPIGNMRIAFYNDTPCLN